MLVHDDAAALGPHHDLVLGVFKVLHLHRARVAASGEERSFVHEVGEVRPREARRAAGEHRNVDVSAHGDLLHVNIQNLFAPTDVGKRHDHLAVKAPRAQKRRVEHVGTVRRGDHDDVRTRLEPVHFDEHLIEGLFAFVVAATEPGAALTAHRVDFVDEDDAGSVLLGALEHVAHAGGADAHEHFDEVRTGNREEGHACLAGDGLGEQRLARTRAAHEQNAPRNAPAETLVFARIAQEVDHFLHFRLGFVAARDVLEADRVLRTVEHAGLGLAEAEGAAAAAAVLHAAHHVDPHADEKEHREPGNEDRREEAGLFLGTGEHLNARFTQILDHPDVARTRQGVFRAALRRHGDAVALDVHAGDLARLGVGHELRVAHTALRRRERAVELFENREEHRYGENECEKTADAFLIQN